MTEKTIKSLNCAKTINFYKQTLMKFKGKIKNWKLK